MQISKTITWFEIFGINKPEFHLISKTARGLINPKYSQKTHIIPC